MGKLRGVAGAKKRPYEVAMSVDNSNNVVKDVSPKGRLLPIIALGVGIVLVAMTAGCNAVDTATGGLTRAEYGKRLQALCKQNNTDIDRYNRDLDDLGERYRTDPNFSWEDYWIALWRLEAEYLEDDRRYLRGVETLKEPLSAGNGGNSYRRYLAESVALNAKSVQEARRAKEAVVANSGEEAAIDRYDAATERQAQHDKKGFLGDRAFINLLDTKAPACLSDVP
jgi:hypothetical protein